MAGDCIMNPTTGVLWDLHTCPVPDDVDPRRVRACIESALEKHFGGPHPVTVFAVGNLDYFSPGLLEKISSSGIFLRHAPCRWLDVTITLDKWQCDGRMTHVLLISGDEAWIDKSTYSMGFTILRAFSPSRPPRNPNPNPNPHAKEWFWESFFKEYSGALHTSSSEVIFKDEPACFCTLCDFSSQSCDGFIEHLETTEHQEQAFLMYSLKNVPVNPSYKPVLFCQVCKYTGHHPRDMATHYRSEEHSQKKLAIQTLEEEARVGVRRSRITESNKSWKVQLPSRMALKNLKDTFPTSFFKDKIQRKEWPSVAPRSSLRIAEDNNSWKVESAVALAKCHSRRRGPSVEEACHRSQKVEGVQEISSLSLSLSARRRIPSAVAFVKCHSPRKGPSVEEACHRSQKVEGVQEISSLSLSLSARRLIPCQIAGDCIMNPTTGVLWDLHTCPVPDDVDPRRVRACIESALEKHFGGPHPVTVFAVGNLDYFSPGLLEKISSSGIFLRHAPCRWLDVTITLDKWQCDGRMTHVLLISGDEAWIDKSTYSMGFIILRAFSPSRPPRNPNPNPNPHAKEWFWESFFKEYSGALHTSSSEVIFKDEPACFCTLCDFSSQSCDGFIEHLTTTEHQERAFLMYSPKNVPVKPSYKPVLFCQVCKYTGHHPRDMATHYRSEEHSQKKLSIQTLEEEARVGVRRSPLRITESSNSWKVQLPRRMAHKFPTSFFKDRKEGELK